MSEILSMMGTSAAGVCLGLVFFGGLWWTTRRGTTSEYAASWFFGSLLLRMSITLVGFYYIGHGAWERLLLCLIGFVIGRVAVTWLTRPKVEQHNSDAPAPSHAP